MLRTIRVRLYPTQSQIERINKNCGSCRFIYNYMLNLKDKTYKESGKNLTRFDMVKLIPNLRKEFEWLKECNAQSLQGPIEDLMFAYDRFFNGGGFPKFKKKDGTGSFRSPQSNEIRDGKLFVPKHGEFKFKCSTRDRKILESGTYIRRVTVNKDQNIYFASILVDLPEKEYEGHACNKVGIDLGVVIPLACYYKSGGKHKYKKLGEDVRDQLKYLERRRKRMQRNLARKKKGSNNRSKARIKVSKAFLRERNVRTEFTEKVSHSLATTFAQINFEDLKLCNMTKSVKKNKDGIRKGRAAKSGLNRELLRLGLSQLVTRTETKAHENCGQVVYVPPFYTSQKCSRCGHTEQKNRKKQAKFKCRCCGYKRNADLNAARNIYAA